MVSIKKSPETKVLEVRDQTISCSGTSSVLGHPKVYLDISPGKTVHCPYCNQAYHHR